MEREREMRKIGEEEWREGKRVGGDGAVVREVEVVEGGRGRGRGEQWMGRRRRGGGGGG